MQRNYTTQSYQNDVVELSFTGTFEDSYIPINLEQASQYSGIHCPSCGSPMLSQKDYESIIKKSSEVSNAQELLDIIRNNKKFIPQKFIHIFNDFEKIDNIQNMNIGEFQQEMSKLSYSRKKQTIQDIKDYLTDYASKFPDSAQQNALNAIRNLKVMQIYQTQKELITQFTKDLDLDYEHRNEIFAKTLKPLFLANGYYMIFNSKKLSEIPENEYGAFIVSRLFYPSVNKITKISQYSGHENLENNKVLVCNGCEQNHQKNVFWKSDDYQNLKDYMKSYLTDISYLMGDGKMDYSYDYVKAFTSIVSRLSKQNITFNTEEYHAIRNVTKITKRHERFAPIEQTQVDIPCAECGSVMLPHSKRKEIEKELKICNTPLDYAQVLQKNMKYIGKNYKVLSKIFLDIIEKNPQISKEKFMKEFSEKETLYSRKSIEKAIDVFLTNRSYIAENYSAEHLKIYDTFTQRLLRYIKYGNFEDYDVFNLFNSCLEGLDIQTYPVKPIFTLRRNLKSITYKHLCSNFNSEYASNDKDPLYTILFNIFKYNVATADHLTAEHKGGDGDKYNLIGMCKSCNRLKSQKDVYNWYIDNKTIEKNLRNQLVTIDNMAKSGKIKGYDDWAKIIAQKVYEETLGKLDLREDFK